jgi:hypothetical protein
MPQILGDVGTLVPVHLGSWLWLSGMATHLLPGLACLLQPTQVAGPASPRLTAKLTANPADNRGSWRTALDACTRPELRRCDYATVGLVLGLRRPANPIGWLFATSGLIWSLTIPFDPWVNQLILDHRPLPLLAKLAAVVGEYNWAPAVA